MSRIYKRQLRDKNGTEFESRYYSISYYFGYNEKGDPVKHQLSLKVEKFSEAKDMQKEIDGYLNEGVDPRIKLGLGTQQKHVVSNVQTIGQLVDDFLENSTMGKETRKDYEYVLKNVLLKNRDSKIKGLLDSGTLLRNITLKTAHSMFNRLRDDCGYSQNTQNTFGTYFRRLFNYGMENGYLKENVISLVKRIPKQIKVKFNTYSDEEIKKIKEYLETDREWFKHFFTILLDTGLRKSELFNLKWSDVDFKTHFIEPLGKGSKYRQVPMNSTVYDILMERKKQYDKLKIKPMDNRVFWQVTHVISVNNRFNVMRKKLGFKRAVHDTRHSFISNFLMNGGDPVKLKKIVGWENWKEFDRYSHLVKGYLREDIDNLTKQYGA